MLSELQTAVPKWGWHFFSKKTKLISQEGLNVHNWCPCWLGILYNGYNILLKFYVSVTAPLVASGGVETGDGESCFGGLERQGGNLFYFN